MLPLGQPIAKLLGDGLNATVIDPEGRQVSRFPNAAEGPGDCQHRLVFAAG
jgi:hypothetical protein